jgi:8-oxo-dGTP pyrophosphatase MutT (NUDIX family)
MKMPAVSQAQENLMRAAAHTPGGYGGVPQAVGKEFVGDEAPIAPQAGPAGRSAGILFRTRHGETLFMHRGDGGDFPRTWGFPGGHLEPGETPEQAARREALEETGHAYEGPLLQIGDDGQFVTFLARIDEQFPVTLCDESTGYTWADAGSLPAPMHPGTGQALQVASAETETDFARLIRDGLIPSPHRLGNMVLFALRISGTGMAYRSKLNEYVWRDSSLYLTPEFLERCNGLPVVWHHPDKNILDSQSYIDSNVGTIVMPYIKGDEVWGIAQIRDLEAAEEMAAKQLSTSPGVAFAETSGNFTITLADGSPMLIEGKPVLLDHLAVCEVGVWDKEGPPEGVQIDHQLTTEVQEMPEEKKDDTVVDSASGAPDSALRAIADSMAIMASGMKALTARVDSLETTKPAPALKAKADDDTKPEPEKAEAKADAEPEKKEEDVKADDDDRAAYADAQARADSVYAAFGDAAPRPLQGEGLMAYRRRLARKLQPHSAAWKDVKLDALGDAAALTVAEGQIYADAAKAARNPVDLPNGQLMEITRTDATGRRISEFRGSPSAWMDGFKAPAQRMVRINKEA